ncbi:hypothetical protein SAY86_021220 [Trapa natans]|uniref:Pyruvate dehydrogenase E1 component subunit beta n=1 Tax=Trapa natans TaxID=22666 RepID=A0AAN7RLE9_TRANT|nr:hypothetical protein SAY86_021220 [Trapa natans]
MFLILKQNILNGGFPVMTTQRIRLAVAAYRSYSSAVKEMTVREALNSALDEKMSANPKVFILGEEISKDHLEKYGLERVLDTLITEVGFTGIGVGATYYGLKLVVEFMTFNFSMQVLLWRNALRLLVRLASSL